MAREKVPEWLNSTMWSTPPPPPLSSNDGVHLRHSQVYRIPSMKEEDAEPIPVAPSSNDDGLLRHSTDSSMKEEAETIPVAPPSSVPSPSSILRNGSSSGEYGNSVGPSAEDLSRQAHLAAELSKKVISLKELRSLALQCLPDSPGIRSTVWKLLLGYLPPDRSLWSTELKQKRIQYKQYKEELLMSPSEITSRLGKAKGFDNNDLKSESRCMLARSSLTDEGHPLSLGKASIWNTYFQDTETIDQIDRDVKRTHPDIPFFSDESSFAQSNQESMKSILLVFAKLNQGIRYVQGMNEILAPIFYVFRNDPDEDSSSHAEADAFFCFVELLSGFRDFYCQQLDDSSVGIRSTITRLSQLVKKHDEELWRHLEITTKVNPQFYAFRWITLLLTQEFSFFDCLHIWDSLLSDPEGPVESLLGICCAMLVLMRRRLMAGDFTSNMKLLQHYPTTNISHLLYVANKLRSKLLE